MLEKPRLLHYKVIEAFLDNPIKDGESILCTKDIPKVDQDDSPGFNPNDVDLVITIIESSGFFGLENLNGYKKVELLKKYNNDVRRAMFKGQFDYICF